MRLFRFAIGYFEVHLRPWASADSTAKEVLIEALGTGSSIKHSTLPNL